MDRFLYELKHTVSDPWFWIMALYASDVFVSIWLNPKG